MYFNTGVTATRNPLCPALSTHDKKLMPHQEWKGGTLQIAYYLESAPLENWRLVYLHNYPEKEPNLHAIKVVGGGILSGYAFFAAN